MKIFIAQTFGGIPDAVQPCLRSSHKRFVDAGLNDGHFDIVAGLLSQSLREIGVAPSLVGEVMVIVESRRDEILNR